MSQAAPIKVPLLDLKPQYLSLKNEIDQAIHRVLEHGQFILGPEVQELEKQLASFVGSKYALSVASGTDALLIALMSLGVGPEDEVITSPFSFFATAEAISLLGAKPVFVDIDPISYNLDWTQIEKCISKKTKAIMPVSLYGQPSDMDEIAKLGQKFNLPVIEDAAQSFGAKYKSKTSCNLSDFGATSFFPAKPFGCYGDGGAVFTNDEKHFKAMSEIRVHGQEARYCHTRIGINGRLDTIQCAILLAKIRAFPAELERRSAIANAYLSAFKEFEGSLRLPHLRADRTSAWAQFTIWTKNRDQFANQLKERGVASSVHYPIPIHKQPVYTKTYEGQSFPKSEEAALGVLSLPLYPQMTDSQVNYVIEVCKSVLRANGKTS